MKNFLLCFIMASTALAAPAQRVPIVRPDGRSMTLSGIDSTILALMHRAKVTGSMETTTENQKIQLSYGLGWGLFVSPAGKVFFKEGHDDGWEHYAMCLPEKKAAFVIMTNSSNGESIYTELFDKLTGITIPWEWEGYAP